MIRADAARAIKGIEHQEELDFFFPEILRIHDHDLATINAWREHIDWYQSLSSHEQQEIKELALETQSEDNLSEEQIAELKIPPEYIYYEKVQEYSHAELLKDSLEILVDPEIRAEYEEYIAERSLAAGLSTLTVDNLQQASPVTLSNLACYFTIQDNSEERDDDALVATEVG